MIYATMQQVVVTAAAVVAVGIIALAVGFLWGHRRGTDQAAEEQLLERQQYGPRIGQATRQMLEWKLRTLGPPEVAHEWRAHEDQALTLANEERSFEDMLADPREQFDLRSEVAAAITTGEIQAITDEMDVMVARWRADNDAWMAAHIVSVPAATNERKDQ